MKIASKIKLVDKLDIDINPATKEGQQSIVDAVNALSGTGPEKMIILDEASSTITYVGYADIGSLTSGAIWKIKRLDSTSGLVVRFADGNANYDNVWDNRASLTYA